MNIINIRSNIRASISQQSKENLNKDNYAYISAQCQNEI